MSNAEPDCTAAMARARSKNLHVWTAGYARWLARIGAGARARGASCRAADRATCCSRSAITTSRSGRTPTSAIGAARVRAWLDGYPRAGRAASATATGGRPGTPSSSPARSTSPATSTRSPAWRAAASARSSCTSTTTATRPRGCARRSPTTSRSTTATATCRATPDGKLALRVHPRQLVPRQRPPRRALVRRRRRAAAAVRDRLLRRLHVPVGARRDPAADRQPDLLARRRSRRGGARTTPACARGSATCGAIAS